MAYATVGDLGVALRKPRLDSSESELAQRCVDAATAEIDNWLDWPDLPDPTVWSEHEESLVESVCVARAVEWWKAPDAAFGAIGFGDTGVLRAPREPFARHAAVLVPLKIQWGVA